MKMPRPFQAGASRWDRGIVALAANAGYTLAFDVGQAGRANTANACKIVHGVEGPKVDHIGSSHRADMDDSVQFPRRSRVYIDLAWSHPGPSGVGWDSGGGVAGAGSAVGCAPLPSMTTSLGQVSSIFTKASHSLAVAVRLQLSFTVIQLTAYLHQ